MLFNMKEDEILFGGEYYDSLSDFTFDASDNPQKIQYNDKCLEYLVPIFLEKDDICPQGNGVIIGSYLITAAHVAQSEDKSINYNKLYYKHDGSIKEVNNEYLVHDGRNVNDKDGCRDDLIIYKLDKSYDFFKFCNDELRENMNLTSMPFICDKDNGIVRPFYITAYYIGQSYISKYTQEETNCYRNCYYVKCRFNDKYINGNSGCALFVDDILYGILIAVKGYGSKCNVFEIENYTVLDAKYIKECIDEYELSRKD